MAELSPPTPAWAKGRSRHALDTRVPNHLKRRGYIPTWPARATVFGVAGVPSDLTVPEGITIAADTSVVPPRLYRRLDDGWSSVNGLGAVGAVLDEFGYGGGYLGGY